MSSLKPIMLDDSFLAKQRFLVISPHADDECYGVAGTIARIKALGGEVFVVLVSVGDLQHYTDANDKWVKGSRRVEEFERVMEYLKVDDWDVLYTDAESHERLDVKPRRELIGLFEREGKLAFDKLKPTCVALPAISYNQDHEAIFRAGHTACRPGQPGLKWSPPLVLAYDNTALFWSLEREKFHPNFYVDITDYLGVKLEALAMHQSQRKDPIHHASVENTRHIAWVRGREVAVEAAEGYQVLRFLV